MKKLRTTFRVIGSIGAAILISLAIKMWAISIIAFVIYAVVSEEKEYD